MLTPDQIDVLRDLSGQVVDPIVEFLIEDIARRVSEAGQLTGTASYQVWRLQQLGVSQKQIKKEIQRRLKVSEKEVERLLAQAAEVGYDFDISRFPNLDALPFSENTSLQQILDATVKLAKDDLTNITQTIGFVTPDGQCLELTKAYQKACDFAFQKVVTGAQDYTSAIRDATRYLSEKGIRTIDYESGIHSSLEAAVRRNIMGGLGLMQEQIAQQNHDDLGCDGWEISAHGGCAPDHEPIQGRQYSDKEYERLNNSLVRRIGTLNCGHSAMPIILGVNEPQYTPEELEKFREENEKGIDYEGKHYTLYEATQRQRSLERGIRKRKRQILIDEAVGDKDKLQADQIRLVRTQEEYHRFSKAAGLPKQYERMEKAGFTWKHGKAAEKVARNYKKGFTSAKENGTIKSIDIDDFEMMADINDVQPEVYEVIGSTIKAFEKQGSMHISEAHFGEFYDAATGKPALFQVFMNANGLVDININSDFLAGKSVEDVDAMMASVPVNLPRSLQEAVVHECGHAKAYYRKTVKEVEAMNVAIAKRGVAGISTIAEMDGAECIAEVEVLLFRGEPIPNEAMALYNEYVKGDKK